VSREWFDLYNCTNCGLTFTANPPVESEIGRYYQSEDYVSHSGSPKGLWGRTYQLARNFAVGSKRRFVQSHTGLKTGVILDYGCGVGFFLKEMQGSGWTVHGVEPAEGARKIAGDKLGKVVVSPESFAEANASELDVVTLWHVLEHLPNPKEILTRIAESMKPGGVLIIAVPNSNSWESKQFGPDWAAWDVPRHLMHYSPTRLEALLTEVGFHPKEFKTLPLDPFYICLLSERQAGKNGQLLRGAWRGVLSFIQGLLNPRVSSSMVWVAKKD